MGADGYLSLVKVEANSEFADLNKCIISEGDLTYCCDVMYQYEEEGLCGFSTEGRYDLFRFMKKWFYAKTVKCGDWIVFFYPKSAEEEYNPPIPQMFVEKVVLPKGYYLPDSYYESGTDMDYSIEYDIPKTFNVVDRVSLNIWT